MSNKKQRGRQRKAAKVPAAAAAVIEDEAIFQLILIILFSVSYAHTQFVFFAFIQESISYLENNQLGFYIVQTI